MLIFGYKVDITLHVCYCLMQYLIAGKEEDEKRGIFSS